MAKSKNNDKPAPWERQPDESSQAFEAFALYRDMGYDSDGYFGNNRSHREVAKQLGKSMALMSRWSSKYNWVDRCAAWDAEKDRMLLKEQQKEIAKMRKRHAAIAYAGISKVALAIKKVNPEDLSPQDMMRFMTECSKLERISRGDVGDVVEEREGEAVAASPVQIYLPDNHRDDVDQ